MNEFSEFLSAVPRMWLDDLRQGRVWTIAVTILVPLLLARAIYLCTPPGRRHRAAVRALNAAMKAGKV